MEFPVPPTEEQIEIVRQCRTLERDAAETFDHLERSSIARLRQSILKSAFEGRLVEQDSRDEPAGCLLARSTKNFSGGSPTRNTRRPRRTALAAE
jgi:type I restriction enzyme S subunit